MKIKLDHLSRIRDRLLYLAYQYDKDVEVRRLTQQFIFMIGALGSGTTILTRILSNPEKVIGSGGLNMINMVRKDALGKIDGLCVKAFY